MFELTRLTHGRLWLTAELWGCDWMRRLNSAAVIKGCSVWWVGRCHHYKFVLFDSRATFPTHSSARILHAGVVLFSLYRKRVHSSKLRALFVFPHLVHVLSHCSHRFCNMCVVDNSVGWAQVVGTSSIANAVKQDTSRDCRRVGRSSIGM